MRGRGGDGESALEKHVPGRENRKHRDHEIMKEHGELVKFHKLTEVG